MTRCRLAVAAGLSMLLASCHSDGASLLSPRTTALESIARVEISYDSAFFSGTDTARLHSRTQTLALTVKAYAADDNEIIDPGFRWQLRGSAVSVDTGTSSNQALVTALSDGRVGILVRSRGIRDSLWVRVQQVAKVVQVTPVTLLMGEGGTQQITVSATDSLDQSVPTRITSVDPAVATVDGSGLVTALAAGRTKIRIVANPLRVFVPLEVRATPLVASIVVSPDNDTISAVGLTSTLTATALDTTGNPVIGASVVWTSSNTSVATVDAGGVVTALAQGRARIRASGGGTYGDATISVIQLTQSVTISAAPPPLGIADTITLGCSVLDPNAQPIVGGRCRWRSLNTAVVSVNGDTTDTAGAGTVTGFVVANGPGTTEIIAERGGVKGYDLVADTVPVTVVGVSPIANPDTVATASVPGNNFHTPYDTPLITTDGSAQDLLTNDNTGAPAATIASFGAIQTNDGAGTLNAASGTVTSNLSGATVSPLPGYSDGSLTVNADGTLSFTPPVGYTGLLRFQYRLTNAQGSSDSFVILATGVRPAVVDDVYNGGASLGNMMLNTAVSSGFSVLTNDAGDNLAIVPVSQNGGTFTFNPNGTFTFAPNVSFAGAAAFRYRARNGFGTTTAIDSLALNVSATRVWFVDRSAATNGNGTQASPFKDLSDLAAVNGDAAAGHPQNDDVIFIYQNAAAYNGSLALRFGQRIYGQDGINAGDPTLRGIAALTMATDQVNPSLLPGDGTTATLTSSGTTISLTGTNGTLRGVTLGNATLALSGFNFSLNVGPDVFIDTNGQAIDVQIGSVNGNFGGVSSSGGLYNIMWSAGGTSNLGGGTLTGATRQAMLVNSSANLTYGGAVSGASDSAVVQLSSTAAVTLTGTLSRTTGNGALLNVVSGHTGTLNVTGQLTASSGTGLKFDNADGTYTLNVAAGSALNGGDAGIDVHNGSTGTFTFGSNMSVTNPVNTALEVSGSAPELVYHGTLTHNTGRVVAVTGLSADSVVIAGNVTSGTAGSPTGLGIMLFNNGGGLIRFRGAVTSLYTGANDAITALINAGTTIEFATALDLNTTTGKTVSARSGGIFNITGTNNSAVTTGAASSAFRLDTINVGSAGIRFATIKSLGVTTNTPIAVTRVLGTGLIALGADTVAGTVGGANFPAGIALANNTAPITIDRISVNGTAGRGLDISRDSGAIVVSNGTIGDVDDAAQGAVAITGGNADVTINAALTQNVGSSRIVNVTTRGNALVDIQGALSCTAACTGINVATNTGGTVRFSSGSKTINTASNSGTALTLATNTGAEIEFTNGGLAVSAGTGGGIIATGGGNLNITGTNNTVVATGAAGVSMQTGAKVGASGVRLASVSTSGGTNGILLNGTGSNLFEVTGTGGVCTVATPTCTGGTIQNPTGTGVLLTNVQRVRLSSMRILDTGLHGISGTTTSGLTIDNSLIKGAGNANNEHGISFDGASALTGTDSIINTVVHAPATSAAFINNTAGTLGLVVTGSTFAETDRTNADAVAGGALFVLRASGVATTTTALFDDNTFNLAGGNSLSALGATNATINITASNNSFDGDNASGTCVAGFCNASAIQLDCSSACNYKYDISGNTILNQRLTAIVLGSGFTGSSFQGRINGNTIGSATSRSASYSGSAIHITNQAGPSYVEIADNIIHETGAQAIVLAAGGTANGGDLHATVTDNNLMNTPAIASPAYATFDAESAEPAAMCVNATGNTVAPGSGGMPSMRLVKSSTTMAFGLEGLPAATADASGFVAGANPAAASPVSATAASGTFTNQTCTTPVSTPTP